MNEELSDDLVLGWLEEARRKDMDEHVLAEIIYPDYSKEENIVLAECEIRRKLRRFDCF